MTRKDVTIIRLNKSIVRALKHIKKYQGKTYNDIIMDLIKIAEETREFDKFVQEAQKPKMKELWGEGDYTAWEKAGRT